MRTSDAREQNKEAYEKQPVPLLFIITNFSFTFATIKSNYYTNYAYSETSATQNSTKWNGCANGKNNNNSNVMHQIEQS